jgi:G-patch domain
MHNQPEAPVPAEGVAKKKQTDGPPLPPPPPPPPVNPGEDESNVGNKLLKMMGWKEGTGLGTSGTGRVEPMFVHFAVWRMLPHSFHPQSNSHICTGGGAWSKQREGHWEVRGWVLRLCAYGTGCCESLL